MHVLIKAHTVVSM